MGLLTQASIELAVLDHIPGKGTASIERAILEALNQVSRDFPIYRRGTLTTTPPATAGTVALTAGSAAVTGTGTSFQATDVNQLFIGEGSSAVFSILSRSSATAIVLSSAWAESNDADATYQIVYPRLSLPSDALYVHRLRIPSFDRKDLARTSLDAIFDQDVLTGGTTGRPTSWAYVSNEGTGTVTEIQVFPYPDQRYVLEGLFQVRGSISGVGGGTVTHYLDDTLTLFKYATLWACFDMIDAQDRAVFWKTLYEQEKARYISSTRAGTPGRISPTPAMPRRWLTQGPD